MKFIIPFFARECVDALCDAMLQFAHVGDAATQTENERAKYCLYARSANAPRSAAFRADAQKIVDANFVNSPRAFARTHREVSHQITRRVRLVRAERRDGGKRFGCVG